jgi:hypothetical protein
MEDDDDRHVDEHSPHASSNDAMLTVDELVDDDDDDQVVATQDLETSDVLVTSLLDAAPAAAPPPVPPPPPPPPPPPIIPPVLPQLSNPSLVALQADATLAMAEALSLVDPATAQGRATLRDVRAAISDHLDEATAFLELPPSEEEKAADVEYDGGANVEVVADVVEEPEEDLCCVCLEHGKTHAFFPCCHWCACDGCAAGVMRTTRLCPICRVASTEIRKMFKS